MEEDWDTISVEEMDSFLENVKLFYEERGSPKVNAVYLADLFLKRLKNDLDYYVNCEGQKGYGKSNLMLLMSLLQVRYAGVYKRKLDGKLFKVLPRTKPMDKEKFERLTVGFKFNLNMSFLDDFKDVERKYHALDKYQSFVIDEGSKNLHKHKWMDNLQFKLVQLSDSVGKDTEILFYDKDILKRMTIENMYNMYGENPSNLFTWCVDNNKKCYLKKLKAIIKKPLRKRMFKIKTIFNKELIVTEDHGIYIYKDGKLKVESPLNLTLKDKVILPVILPSKETIKEDNDMMQLYGAWIADGSYSWDKMANGDKENARVEISGKEHIELIKRIQKKYNVNYNLAKNGIDISINSKPFTKKFMEKGFTGDSYTKRIPEWVYNTTMENKIAFLKGLFTGDGSIDTTGEPSYVSVNKKLIKDVQTLLNMIGIQSSLYINQKPNIYENHQTNNCELYIPNLFYSSCLKLFEESKLNYNVLKNYQFDKGKYNKVKFIDKDCLCVQIKEIKEITNEYMDEVYDLEIDKIHNFIASGILAHNTERWQNKTFFICFPNFSELNSSFRNNRIMMRLYVYHRDVNKHFSSAIISLKDVNRHVPNPWHTEENATMYEELLKRKPAALRNHNDILYAEQRLKGYAGSFDIPELKIIAPRIWDIYMKYKIMNAKKETVEPGEEETESERILRWKKVSLNLAEWIKTKDPTLTYTQIAQLMGIAPITFSQLRALKPLQPKEEKAMEKIVWRVTN
jgi:intein/homing endonuclease